MTRIFFVTDIHGSNLCFRKFLSAARAPNGPDVQIIGGDITGKYIVPIVERRHGYWNTRFEGKSLDFNNLRDLNDFEKMLGDTGIYPWRCDPSSLEHFYSDKEFQNTVDRTVRIQRLRAWIDLADQWLEDSHCRVFISGGNDDPLYIDEVLRQSKKVLWPEGKVLPISDSLVMLSSGVANLTPWECPRDVSESEIASLISGMAAQVVDFNRCIFNLHCPPVDTLLDRAPKLTGELQVEMSAFGVKEESVGSSAVRQAIEQYQPVASLHGHIHESRGFQRIKKTVCLNPGSEYSIGRLNGAFLEFKGAVLEHFELVRDIN